MINPVCKEIVLERGGRAERCVILLHGFTNCPAMYRQLAVRLYELGSNVYVPLLPRHGLQDRLNTELAALKAAELTRACVDALARGTQLGEEVTVAGISLGAVLAAWLAQRRPEVDRAVIVAPIFCAPHVPEWLSDGVAHLAELVPNFWLWWDPKAKAAVKGPPHAYPRFPSRAYAEMLKLGYEVKQAARSEPPRARELRVVINQNDPAVNNKATLRLVQRWRRQGAQVSVYQFPKEQGLLHDLISADQVYQRIDVVYPVLIDQITRAVP